MELGAGKEELLHEFAVQGDVKVKECVLRNPHTSPDTVRYVNYLTHKGLRLAQSQKRRASWVVDLHPALHQSTG